MKGRVLSVAGSDSGGGAGIQADIKAVTVLGGFAATAITALTAQNTQAVHDIFPVPPDFITRQIDVVLEDLGADCIKIGMLGNAATIEAVADCLARKSRTIPVVLDPVMVATSGGMLLATGAIEVLVRRLFPRADLVTPNLPEAEALTGQAIGDLAGMKRAAQIILDMGPKAVLLKGGHLDGDMLTDLLLSQDGFEIFQSPRIDTIHTHGTGCTLASAIAVGLAQDMTLRDAVIRARAYVRSALQSAPGFGRGHGPINHGAWIQTRR